MLYFFCLKKLNVLTFLFNKIFIINHKKIEKNNLKSERKLLSAKRWKNKSTQSIFNILFLFAYIKHQCKGGFTIYYWLGYYKARGVMVLLVLLEREIQGRRMF